MAQTHKPDRCSGHCCRFFTLSQSWEQVKRLKRRRILDGVIDFTEWQESFFVVDMLIPVGKGRDGTQRYTCRHLSQAGQCTAYDRRPRMCKEFGVVKSNPCIFKGVCTWTSGLHGPSPDDAWRTANYKGENHGSKESKAAPAQEAGAQSR